MKKFKFLKISKTKKLRYISNYYKKNLYIIFLPGFASDIEGDKPKRFLNYAKKNKLGFLALEYSGYGKSSGEFTKGNISTWANDAKQTIKNIVKKNDIIFDIDWQGTKQLSKYKNLDLIKILFLMFA